MVPAFTSRRNEATPIGISTNTTRRTPTTRITLFMTDSTVRGP